MKKMNMIKFSLFLAVVCGAAGLLLSTVHDFTKPIIAAQSITAEKVNLEKLFPNGQFSAVNYTGNNENVLAIYCVKDKGTVIKINGVGYNSSVPISVLVAFNQEGETIGLKVLQQQETNGIGSRCFEKDFIEKAYIHKKDGDRIDALAGATYTSSAMKNMMDTAFKAYREMK